MEVSDANSYWFEKDKSYHKDIVICEYHGAIGGNTMYDQTHGIMYYDGRYKICIYEGHELGARYTILWNDLANLNNLWLAERTQKDLKT